MEADGRKLCRLLPRAERVACVLRLAVGLLLVVMTVYFEPALPWLAVTAAVTAIGWSLLMALALRSDLAPAHLAALAHGSYWFDIVLALTVYVVFLPDPVATPVAALPLLVFRVAARHGRAGAVGGAVVFVGLVTLRIVLNRVFVADDLVRPPLLLAWSLVAVLVLVLALEMRARTSQEPADVEESVLPAGAPHGGPTPVSTISASLASPGPEQPTDTTTSRIDDLAACLSLRFDPASNAASLTQREQEILLLLGQGHSYAAVAGRLYISASTVRNHVHNIRGKLDLADRDELLALAREVAARTAPSTQAGDSPQAPAGA